MIYAQVNKDCNDRTDYQYQSHGILELGMFDVHFNM